MDRLYKEYIDKCGLKNRLIDRRISMSRDSQAEKTYSSETLFDNANDDLNIKFKNIKEANEYAKKILKYKAWKKIMCPGLFKRPAPNIIFKSHKSLLGMYCGGGLIWLSTKGMTSFTLIHELIHYAGYDHHDAFFRHAQIKIISAAVSRETASSLKEYYKADGLKCNLPKKIKPLSYKDWKIKYLRLEDARNKRKIL